MLNSKRVAIIHPWFPNYRAAFFSELLQLAGEQNMQIDVFYGQTPPEWAARSDATSSTYAEELPTRFTRLGGKIIITKSLRSLKSKGNYDLVIVEHAVRNLETYRLLCNRHQPVAFWGHGRTYSSESSGLQEKFKRWLSKRGTWFFAYTTGGAEAVIAGGFPRDRVTAVQNAVASEKWAAENTRGGVWPPGRRVALYIGGLDGPKRIDFLLAAAELAHSNDSRFELIVAGDGAGREQVEDAAHRYSWLTYVGRVVGQEKASLLSSADVLAIPGSVGLVAVDSFVGGVPIVTTDWPLHGPEFEYLIDGVNAVVAANSLEAYAETLNEVLSDRAFLQRLRAGCAVAAGTYTVENMASRFMRGLVAALEIPSVSGEPFRWNRRRSTKPDVQETTSRGRNGATLRDRLNEA